MPRLGALAPSDLADLAGACERRRFGDRELVLRATSTRRCKLLAAGTVAVRVQRGGRRETVAELTPPAIFGELSFITGRTCSAVERRGPIEVVTLTSDALAGLGSSREAVLRTLLGMVAGRLRDTMTGRPALHRPRTVWLRADERFRAPLAFAHELARGLRACSPGETLVIADGLQAGPEPRVTTVAGVHTVAMPDGADGLAARLAAWNAQFRYTVVLERGEAAARAGRRNGADVIGDLLGGGAPLAPVDADSHLMAADAGQASIDVLSGGRQLLFDAESAERAIHGEGEMPRRFRRTAGSLARRVAAQQVGLAFGGGGACCWAHIGLLSVLEQEGIPVDVVAGCSMGSFVGALVGAGKTVEELTAIAEYWRTRKWRMAEWRLWRMHLMSERGIRRALAGYFGERQLNSLEIPFWANAVDVVAGEEVVLDRGRISDTIRASMALPGSSPAFESGQRVLVDAAVMAPVPVGPVRAMGADFVIAMNVMPSMRAGLIARRQPLRYFDILFRALRISGHEIGRNRAVGEADILLTPDLEQHSLLDFGRCHEIIRAGSEAAHRHRAQIAAGYQGMVALRG
ncbi:MAG: cyclic nucleotide-binding and patatin-like phospholipase domain-containing protein [Vicinamibacterales bacterium]